MSTGCVLYFWHRYAKRAQGLAVNTFYGRYDYRSRLLNPFRGAISANMHASVAKILAGHHPLFKLRPIVRLRVRAAELSQSSDFPDRKRIQKSRVPTFHAGTMSIGPHNGDKQVAINTGVNKGTSPSGCALILDIL